MNYHYNKDLSNAEFEIKVDTESLYGYFEHNILGDNCGGGLWFETLEGGVLALIDYDGVFELPSEVRKALVADSIVVDADFA